MHKTALNEWKNEWWKRRQTEHWSKWLTVLTCSRSSLYAAAQLLPAIKTRRCRAGSSTPAAALYNTQPMSAAAADVVVVVVVVILIVVVAVVVTVVVVAVPGAAVVVTNTYKHTYVKKICNSHKCQWTSPWTKLRIAHSGDWCLRLVLRTQ